MHDLIENRPLARGFIENGNFHILIQWPFTEEFTTFQTLGKSLCDFMRADSFYLRTFLDLLLSRYIRAKEHKNDYDFLAAVLMQTAMEHGLIGKNNYLTVYFLSFIQLLLEGDTDPRILVDEDTDQITHCLHRLEAEESSVPSDLAKQYIVLMYMSWIEDRQENVGKTLSMILERKETDGMTPIQRYYDLEQNDEEFAERWHSEFISQLGQKAEGYEIQQFTILDDIDDMLRYELVETLVRGVEFKRCKNCGMLFVPTGRSDAIYCDFIMPGEKLPCNKIGANRQAKRKVADDPVLMEYRRAYQRLNKRVELGYMEKEAFQAWSKEAKARCTQCQKGDISMDEYKNWLDKTSRQRKEKLTE